LNPAGSNAGLGVVPAAKLRRLGLADVPGFLNDHRDLGVGQKVLEALLVPIEEHPDPVGFNRVANRASLPLSKLDL